MSAAWITWPAGLAVSALVNAGALTGLALILQPAPVPDQPSPEMQLDVAAYRLDRTQAAPAAPQRMVYRFVRAPFLPPPEAARVARMDVESIIQVSRSIRPSSRSWSWRCASTASKVPSSRHWRNRSYTVDQGP